MFAPLALSLSVFCAPPPSDLDELEALQIVMRSVLDRVSPSVVTITTRGGIRVVKIPDHLKDRMSAPNRPRDDDPEAPERDGPGKQPERKPKPGERFKKRWQAMLAPRGFKKAEGPTTGVILSEDGHILTSAWNFESKPTVIIVNLPDGDARTAKLLGIDRAAGLAMLKVDTKGKKLKVPTFRNPKEVQVGAWAFALGRTITAQEPEIKYGVVSARNRIDGKALQTDAAVSPANYGGPLVDVEGRVYGILVPLGSRGEEANPNWYDAGIGFAVPVTDAKRLIDLLGKEGVELKAAFLGVMLEQDRTDPGSKVTGVVPEGPAQKAGIQKDDLIVAVEGEKVDNAFTLRFALGRKRAGEKIKLQVKRGDKLLDVVVDLTAREQEKANDGRLPTLPGRGGDDE